MRPLRIGTRGSQLALWQARTVAARLEASGTNAELVIIKTAGDRLQDAPLSSTGGKRLFVKEIEDALLRGDVDLAVHSAKDMPAELPETLEIGATLPREDARDAIVLPAGAAAENGSRGAVLRFLNGARAIGTSSVRRVAQLARLIERSGFRPIRGNVDTRLRMLDSGEFDALVLAAAGLKRLGFGDRITATLPVSECVPAPGQGIVAVEIRAGDEPSRAALARTHDGAAGQSLLAERELIKTLGGGCQLPLGAIAVHYGAELEMHAIVCSADGSRAVRGHGRGSVSDAAGLGQRVADDMIRAGAVEILSELRPQ
jgi:hydroxymethylbilane synthase